MGGGQPKPKDFKILTGYVPGDEFAASVEEHLAKGYVMAGPMQCGGTIADKDGNPKTWAMATMVQLEEDAGLSLPGKDFPFNTHGPVQ